MLTLYYHTITTFNSSPDDKILDWSKLKQIADDMLKVHLKWKTSTL